MGAKFPDRYEIVEGAICPTAPLGVLGATAATELTVRLGTFARQQRLGLVLLRGLFPLRPGLSRRPVVAFLANERVPPAEVVRQDAEHWLTPPNLAVDILSPEEDWAFLLARVPEYFAAGVQQVWVVKPTAREVHNFTATTRVHVLGLGDELIGDPVLPGFRCPVSELFQ